MTWDLKVSSKNQPDRKIKRHVLSWHLTDGNGAKAIVTNGNQKLHNMLIFNLPALESCPGKTDLCRRICYANKGYNRPRNWTTRADNWKFSRTSKFMDGMRFAILGTGLKLVRVHESGDFYNQAYLNKWFGIAEQLPNITFYAFTRSHMLDFSDIPENFTIRYSVDETTTCFPAQDLPQATLIDNGGFKCQATVQGMRKVGCNKPCRVCFTTQLPVIFEVH